MFCLSKYLCISEKPYWRRHFVNCIMLVLARRIMLMNLPENVCLQSPESAIAGLRIA